MVVYLLFLLAPVWTVDEALAGTSYALALVLLVNALPWRPGVAPAFAINRWIAAPVRPRRADPAGPPAYGQLTHSSVPSAKTWRFQIGSRAFASSTSRAQAAKAAARCAVLTAATRATSPIRRVPTRCETATA